MESAPSGSGNTEPVPLGSDETDPPRGVGRDGNYALNRPGELMFVAISSLPPCIPNIDTRHNFIWNDFWGIGNGYLLPSLVGQLASSIKSINC
jgi:hypothetical protein